MRRCRSSLLSMAFSVGYLNPNSHAMLKFLSPSNACRIFKLSTAIVPVQSISQAPENSCNSLIGYDRMFDLVSIEIDQIGPLQDCCVTVHYCWDNVFTVKTNEPLV